MSVLTEAEALHKWCPFAQVAVAASDDIVANTLSGKAVTCAASGCMAWRWFDTLSDDGTQCQLKPTPHAARTPLPDLSPLSERRGFCGMAGAQ